MGKVFGDFQLTFILLCQPPPPKKKKKKIYIYIDIYIREYSLNMETSSLLRGFISMYLVFFTFEDSNIQKEIMEFL